MPVDCTATDESQLDCTCICCSNEMEAYQPKQRDILEQFSRKGRHFVISWYEKHIWITLCVSQSVFQVNFSIPQLEKQLSVLVDVIRVERPDVKLVTNIRTICTAEYDQQVRFFGTFPSS